MASRRKAALLGLDRQLPPGALEGGLADLSGLGDLLDLLRRMPFAVSEDGLEQLPRTILLAGAPGASGAPQGCSQEICRGEVGFAATHEPRRRDAAREHDRLEVVEQRGFLG